MDARLTWLCLSPQEAMLTVPAFQRSVQGCLSPPLTVQVPSIALLVLVFFCWATSSRQLRNLVPLPVPLWGCLSLLVGPLTSHGRLPPHMGSLLTFPGLPCPALGCLRGDALLSPSGSDFLCCHPCHPLLTPLSTPGLPSVGTPSLFFSGFSP